MQHKSKVRRRLSVQACPDDAGQEAAAAGTRNQKTRNENDNRLTGQSGKEVQGDCR